MTKAILAATLSLLALAGCSAPAPPDRATLSATWCLDMDDERAVVFVSAMDEWNARTGVTEWRRDEEACTMRAYPVPAGDSALHNATGHQAMEGIAFNEALPVSDLRHVALHELGHVAWLGHSSDERDVMYPVWTPVSDLSEGDLEAFRRINW
jgi:hypothetical protein